MRRRKVRGLKKYNREIERWCQHNLDLDTEQLLDCELVYTRPRINPWYFCLGPESMPGPVPGGLRDRMLAGLLEIHDSWERTLSSLGMPYYLKVHWFYPRFMRSEVIAAVGSKMEMYNRDYPVADGLVPTSLPPVRDIELKERLSEYQWRSYTDIDVLIQSDFFGPDALYSPELFDRYLDGYQGATVHLMTYPSRENRYCVCVPQGTQLIGGRSAKT